MHGYQTDRHETIRELYELFVTVQKMGQVFANTSHGAAHKDARELNELLHLVRLKIEEIHVALPAMGHASEVDESVVMARFTTQWEAPAARR
ncbi:MAG: hypothetical protein U9R55_03635 [Pseudomonadota bacterium]|jgi:hypothetical protein|uniref:hypothetical protein n=1 Tax=Curvibacter delicatus TaxID=80879 RepID=UPI000ABCE905|nr:hypothetical protein [Curvibacter delicatus]MEA3393703.1 hypothetical protein [Pseudomonadota bacterium]